MKNHQLLNLVALVLVGQLWFQSAEAKPEVVGRFSDPKEIVIRGCKQVPKEEVYAALGKSSGYVLAAHPSADFDEYLKKLQRCLELGYLRHGFPDAKIVIMWDEAEKNVVADIKEGTRYRAGKILIKGCKVIESQVIQEALIEDDNLKERVRRREELVYESLAQSKQLWPGHWIEHAKKAFPEKDFANEAAVEIDAFGELKNDSSEEEIDGIWKEGDWVNLYPQRVSVAEMLVHMLYAKAGHYFPEIDVSFKKSAVPETMDLVVNIDDEGPSSHLGKVHVSGNRINSRDDILGFLGLKEGMELKGNFIDQIERKLFGSARFSGWKVMMNRPDPAAVKIDLLIHVEEYFEAPKLSDPLTAEQQVMMRLVKWMNEDAGKSSDIVLNMTVDDDKNTRLMLAMSDKAIGFVMDGQGHHLFAVGEWGKQLDFLVRTDLGASFRGSMPLVESKVSAVMQFYTSQPANPLGKLLGMSIGTGMSSVAREPLVVAMDPTLAIQMCGSYNGSIAELSDGKLQIWNKNLRLIVDEETGALVSITLDLKDTSKVGAFSAPKITMMADPKGIQNIRNEMAQFSKGIPNWSDGKPASSMAFMALAYMVELAKEDPAEDDTFLELSTRAGQRAMKWSPIAELGGSLMESWTKKDDEENDEEAFYIPVDPDEQIERLLAGQGVGFLLGSGIYDAMMKHIEPGTWPELVVREILFLCDGKSMYLGKTVDALIADKNMGPIGSLICASLLKQAKHPAQKVFLAKAKAEANADGFAKDWKLVISGKVEEGSVGWSLLKSLKKFDEAVVDDVVPETESKLRMVIKDLIRETKKINEMTKAAAFKPMFDALWEHGVQNVMMQSIEAIEKSSQETFNPKLFAAVVGETPVPRPAVSFVASVEAEPLNTLYPNLAKAWSSLKADENQDMALEKSAVATMLALDLWKTGRSPEPRHVQTVAQRMLMMMGEDGVQQIQEMGFDQRSFMGWVAILMSAEVQCGLVELTDRIDEKDMQDWYQAHLDQFKSESRQAHVHTIRLDVNQDLDEMKKLAESIRAKVTKAKGMEEILKVFATEAKEHSKDYFKDAGGDGGWLAPDQEFHPKIAEMINGVKGETLSDVQVLDIEGRQYVFLVLISEKWRNATVMPFEKVKSQIERTIRMERYVQKLRSTNGVVRLGDPTAEKNLSNKLGFVDRLYAAVDKLAPGEDKEPVEPKESERSPKTIDEAVEGMKLGHAIDGYFLGMLAERKVAPNSGMQAAVSNYEMAAKGGNCAAMLRLSELYRTGRGVEQSEEKARAWRESAKKSLSQ